MEQLLYTGWLSFRDDEFAFSFNGEELHLIPTTDKKDKYKWDWFHENIAPGVYIPKTDKVKERFLVGECYETKITLSKWLGQGCPGYLNALWEGYPVPLKVCSPQF